MRLSSRRGATLMLLVALFAGARMAAAQNSVSENHHGAWTVRCEGADGDAARNCIMFQNLVLKTGGQPVLQFAIGLAPGAGTPTVLMSLPLGIALPPGITIRIDDGKSATFPVERCEPDGCQAGMKLREATIEQLRGGNSVEITFYDGQREAIRMPLSLDGFTAAFADLRSVTGGTAPPSTAR